MISSRVPDKLHGFVSQGKQDCNEDAAELEEELPRGDQEEGFNHQGLNTPGFPVTQDRVPKCYRGLTSQVVVITSTSRIPDNLHGFVSQGK